jgi:hypothetical protein
MVSTKPKKYLILCILWIEVSKWYDITNRALKFVNNKIYGKIRCIP